MVSVPFVYCTEFCILYWYIAVPLTIAQCYIITRLCISDIKEVEESLKKGITNFRDIQVRGSLLKEWENKSDIEKDHILREYEEMVEKRKMLNPRPIFLIGLLLPFLYIFILNLIGFSYKIFP